MLMMYPEERPVYTEEDDDALSAEVSLHFGDTFATAVTRLRSSSGVFLGISRVKRTALIDKLATDRMLQKIIKLSFYKAAVSALGREDATGKKPVWGALTGIRPGKIATGLLERGISDKKVLKTLTNDYFVSRRASRQKVRCVGGISRFISASRFVPHAVITAAL
jgi:oxygen-independent coproporphyrinogen-3 oxidase